MNHFHNIMVELCDNPAISGSTWHSVSAAWYHVYGKGYLASHMYGQAVNSGVVFG